nr:hypothetical protein [Tanacetum cinerariifolium]
MEEGDHNSILSTLAQALVELKHAKPKSKAKGIVSYEPEELTREKAQQEEEANIALIETWDDIQAKVDVDYQLAEKLQAEEQEELTDEEKARLVNTFVDYKTELVEESSKKAESEVMKQERLKRAGTEVEQESSKKQNIDDKETAELKQLVKIIPDEKRVAIDAIPLVVKPPRIVYWKIHKEGKKTYYQIIRADGSSNMYLVFSHMLKDFDREDMETL